MPTNPVRQLAVLGQSVWYDNIQRSLLASGRLAELIADSDVRGVTSNPSIFAQAIARSDDYDARIAALAHSGKSALDIYETLAVEDIQAAADIFHPVYIQTGGQDGYVSLEVSPLLAADTAGTIAEAKRLWQRLDRPNVMIKVPATPQGLPAITALTTVGINVNVTLLFSRQVYEQAAQAYIAGLQQRYDAGLPLHNVRSVASVFVSRVDTAVDALFAQRQASAAPAAADPPYGRVAVANARLIYQAWQRIFQDAPFQRLAAHGATAQRLLWASTGTKNPAYSDVLYVEELIGPHTVTTLPPATLAAFRDHGRAAFTLTRDIPQAAQMIRSLQDLGIDFDAVCATLLSQGVQAFQDAFASLLTAIAAKAA